MSGLECQYSLIRSLTNHSLIMTIDLQYLPSLEYFCALLKHDTITIEAHEYFEKQSYRNRCKILTTNKIDVLTVPVKNGNTKILINP